MLFRSCFIWTHQQFEEFGLKDGEVFLINLETGEPLSPDNRAYRRGNIVWANSELVEVKNIYGHGIDYMTDQAFNPPMVSFIDYKHL